MLKQFSLSVAILIATEASAQLSPIDVLAEDLGFRFHWDAGAHADKAQLSIELCPRGTCDYFVSANPNLESFLMFVDSYIVFAAQYGDLKRLNQRADGRIAPGGVVTSPGARQSSMSSVSSSKTSTSKLKSSSCDCAPGGCGGASS